jgi:hypothetical protein
MKYFFYVTLLLFSLGSCIEIIDDISIKSDGSGTFKYTVNLSASKIRINSVLALDSLDGKKVPSIAEIQEKIEFYKGKIEKKEGISNVKVETNYNDFILKFQCDFTNVQALQKAVREIVIEESREKNIAGLDHTWLSWDGMKLVRSVPDLAAETTNRFKAEDTEALQKGSYISITRFDRPVEKFENKLAQLSANKLAVKVATNPYTLSQNGKILENTIYLIK